MSALPIFLRAAELPVMLIGSGEAADAKRRLLEQAGARIVDEAAAAPLAIVAIEDDAAATATVARLKARGVLVNAVDRPALCDFTLPAIVDRAPVIVAIGTGGASAGLAAALRQRIEAMLPARLDALAGALQAARGAMRARWPDGGERRRALGAALAAGGALDPLADPAADAVAIWLASAAAPASRCEKIVLRSADPDDLTLREARLLALADRLYHAPSVPPAILARARADAERIAGRAPATPLPGLAIEVVQA